MRTEREMYSRKRGYCDMCHKQDTPVTIMKMHSGFQVALCRRCLLEGVRKQEIPPPRKKPVPVSEIPENKAMASIQRGLADTEAGRTSAVNI